MALQFTASTVVLKCLWMLCCSVCGCCVAVSVDVVLKCLWMLC